jgi:hypothetical protein
LLLHKAGFELCSVRQQPGAAAQRSSARTASHGKEHTMADWHDAANRALTLLQSDSSDAGTRTTCIINHVLDENNLDSYISKDFFNVQ